MVWAGVGLVEGLVGDGVVGRVGELVGVGVLGGVDGLVGVGVVGGPLRVGGLMVVSILGGGTGQYYVGRVICTCSRLLIKAHKNFCRKLYCR